MTERWADLYGHEETHSISDRGTVRRKVDGKSGGWKAGMVLRANVDPHGYKYLTLRKPDGKSSLIRPHVAILESFVCPRPKGCDASHINGVQTDNRLENLCWETSSENHRRKLEHGTLVHGEKHKCSKLKTDQVRAIRQRAAMGEVKKHIAAEYGVSNTLVCKIVKREAWPHLA